MKNDKPITIAIEQIITLKITKCIKTLTFFLLFTF